MFRSTRTGLAATVAVIAAVGAASAQDTAPTAITRQGTPPAAQAGLPLWEVGVAGGAGWLPDYPAAEQNHVRGLALPFIRYRGDFLRSDEKGLLRGRFIHTPDVEVDISLNGSFPTTSEENRARAGMPDLDWLGEIGPRVEWTLARAARDVARIQLDIPVRTVWSTNFKDRFDYRGVLFQPELAYRHDDFLTSGVRVKAGIAPTFASEELMDMFYGVDTPYVTATRAAYDAEAGYLGTRLQLTAARALTPWVAVHGLLEARFHQGATNSDSPLFRDDTNFAAGIGLTFTMAKSRTTVPRQ